MRNRTAAKRGANRGFPKVYWTTVIILAFFLALGAVFWWLDGYLLAPR